MPTTLKRANVKVKVNGQFQDLGLLQSDVATQLADEIAERKSNDNSLEANKIPYPLNPNSKYGNAGDVLRTDGAGGTKWVPVGQPTDEQTQDAINNWFYSHPDATVQNHSLTYEKLVNGTLGFVTPQMFGAKGDGVTDDTDAMINCFTNNYCIFIPDGTYMIQGYGNKKIDIQSNSTILMSQNATLKIITNSETMYFALRITNKTNIVISGGNIIGDFDTHTGTEGQAGMGIGIYHSSDIIIENIKISNCWGDGIYIAADLNDRTLKSNNIKIQNCTIYNCRRQGISVAGCDNISIINNTIYDIAGTAPQAGIDCEPNTNDTDGTSTYSNTRVLIAENQIYNTSGFSIQLYNGNDAIVTNNKIDNFENRKNYLPVLFTNNILKTATIGTDNQLDIINCEFKERVIIIGSLVNGIIHFNNCKLCGLGTATADGANANKTHLKLIGCHLESTASDVTTASNNSRIMRGTYYSIEIKNCHYNSAHERGFGEFKGDDGVIIDGCSFNFEAPQYNVSGKAFDIASANKKAIVSNNRINYHNCTYKDPSGSFSTDCDLLFEKNTIVNAQNMTYLFRKPATNIWVFNNILKTEENYFCSNQTEEPLPSIIFANNVYNQNIQI